MVEVFSEVRAILSSTVINSIDGSVEDTLRKHAPNTTVLKLMAENNMQYCLLGTLEEIIAANQELQTLLSALRFTEILPTNHFNLPIVTDKENTFLLNQNPISSHKSSSSETPIEKDSSIISELCELKRKACVKKLRFHLRERPRSKQRNNALKSIHRHRYPKRKHILEKRMNAYETEREDSDALIRNLEEMKLSTENSSDGEGKLNAVSSKENFALKKNKDYESVTPYKYFCELCSFKSKRSSHFAKHMSIHEKVNTLYKCSHCPFTSVRLSHLRRHEMSHSSTVYACTQCHYKTDDVKFLSRHVRLKHCSMHNDKKFSVILNCSHCSYHTTKQHYFERHQRMHGSKEKSTLHQCEQCCYKTHRKEHFVRHMNNVHSNKRPFLCHLCGKTFKRGDALQQHHQTHTEVKVSENMNFKCDICEKNFRSHSHLGEHRAVHSEERSFLCEICGASFKTRSVQRKHVATIHRNPRAYSCGACSKRFNTLYALKRHQKVHNGKAHTEQESEAEVDDVVKNFIEHKDETEEPVSIETSAQELNVGNTSTLDVVPVLSESLAVDAVALPIQPTVLSSTDIIQQITPTFFQSTDNVTTATTTTLLYLTNSLPQF